MTDQKTSAPKIGFDRFIALEWAAAALRVRAGMGTIEDLDESLDQAGMGKEARRKSLTVLKRLWLQPYPEFSDFAERGVKIFKDDPSVPAAVLTWGMAITTYPFFGKVAELIGRLSALQGDCAVTEVRRRMSEIYGEREGTQRTTYRVIQTQADWGAVEHTEKGKRLVRLPQTSVNNEDAVAWLIEAVVRYVGKALPVSAISSQAVLYPFGFEQSLGYLISRSPNLAVHSQGPSSQYVTLPQND